MVAIALLLLQSSLSFAAVETAPLQSILGKVQFQLAINSPSQLALCKDTVIVYSVADRALIGVDRSSGQKLFTSPVKGDALSDVSALTCRDNELLVLTNHGKQKNPEIQKYTFSFVGQQKTPTALTFTRTFRIPHSGRATDLSCSKSECELLQDGLWKSKDLSRWQQVEIPSLKSIKLPTEQLDPFADWQSSLILAKEHFIKFAKNSRSEYALLDRHRSQFAVQNESRWSKHGGFGVWEGSLLDPNAIAFVTDDILAITDAKLKVLFFFRTDGSYLGIAQTKAHDIYSPLYPLGLVAKDGFVFVTDFRENKLMALAFTDLSLLSKVSSSVNVRQNLFRRAEVTDDRQATLCLSCHDGVESNQLQKFLTSPQYHPLACGKCHDSHHEAKFPHNLQNAETPLCASCHLKFATPATNHVWRSHSKAGNAPESAAGGKCEDCHGAHVDAKNLLIKAPPELCLSCHADRKVTHRDLSIISLLDSGKKSSIGDIHLENGKISCATCHETHLTNRKEKFLRPSLDALGVCASCHGGRAERLYRNFHNKPLASGTKKDSATK